MLTCPRIGQAVQLHYAGRAVASGIVPHHGQVGVVVVRKTKGKPRNHLVRLDGGQLVVVNAGNLRRHAEPGRAAKTPI